MNVRKSIIIWSFVLIILSLNVDVDGAKASRRGGNKKAPNYDHVQLSYGSHGHKNTHHQPVPQHQNHQQQHQQQVHHTQAHHPPQQHPPQQHQTQQHSPSAPPLPTNNNNNNPVGWNVHHTDTVNQPKTVSNTQSALPYPQNPPPYQQNTGFNAQSHPAGPPPPYSANPNPTFNSHPPAGAPPAYSPNASPAFGSQPGVQPPAYQPAPSYPVHNAPNPGYPQQTYQPNPNGAPNFAPNGQQAPVINNYYGQPQGGSSSGGGGSSFLGTALAAGAGSLAGNALYGALKPDSDPKTIIIHDNNNPAPAAAPAVPAVAPVAAPVAPVAPIAPTVPVQPVPLAPMQPVQPVQPVPVVTGETTTGQPQPIGLYPTLPGQPQQFPQFSQSPQDIGGRTGVDNVSPMVPLAPIPDQPVMQPNAPFVSISPSAPFETTPFPTTPFVTASNVTNTTIEPTTTTAGGVPLAPYPNDNTSQAHLKGGATTFVIFNISVYTIVSILIASIF